MDARHHPYARSTSAGFSLAEDSEDKPDTEIVSMKTHRQSESGNGDCESEEEYTLRMLAHRRSQSRSPVAAGGKNGGKSGGNLKGGSGNGKGRSVSYTTTTMTMTKSYDVGVGAAEGMFDDAGVGGGAGGDEKSIWEVVANLEGEGRMTRPKTPKSSSNGSGSGSGMIGVQKTRAATSGSSRRSGGEDKCRVRKTSGRVGSQSHSASVLR